MELAAGQPAAMAAPLERGSDLYTGQHAPEATGVWKIDLTTGAAQLIVSLKAISELAFPLADGYQHLFMFHRPTKLFVPLAKLKNTARPGIHRVDLHVRASRDGRIISFDSSHEGKGRQFRQANPLRPSEEPCNRSASSLSSPEPVDISGLAAHRG
jgi:hypothetical protein